MKNTVTNWLKNPARDYRDGVLLFEAVVPKHISAQYLDFIRSGNDEIRMGIIRSRLERALMTIPADLPVPESMRQKRPSPLRGTKRKMKERLQADLRGDLMDEVREELRDELEYDVREELKEELREELPAELQVVHDRIKEIRPLQASIHASILSEIDQVKRKAMRDDLIKLEEERRDAWSKIDEYVKCDKVDELENPVARGARLQKRAKQLRQNIARGKASEAKMTAYKKELESIENELNV